MSDYSLLVDNYAFAIIAILLGVTLLVCVLWKLSKWLRPVTHPTSTITQYDWHILSVAQALHRQSTQLRSGLSYNDVKERQKHYGLNKLAEKPPEPAWHLLLSQFKSVLILVLIIAAITAAVIGDITDGIVILIVVAINACLGFYQEFQAEKSLAMLKKMLALHATVRRDKRLHELSADQLVPGDIVILEAGNKIPADGRIVAANNLAVDESSFTGESAPVSKHKHELKNADTPLAERFNMLYMNNSIVRGRAEMLVTATGMNTEIGKLANMLAHTEDEATPLQIQLDSLGKRLALFALAVVLALFGSAILRGEPLIETAFTAIALAVAAIPEGLPSVVTVTLALGMHRMAKQRAIIKRLSAVETLGCTTVICTDKTGTLTLNKMTARSLYYKELRYYVSGESNETTGDILPSHESASDLTDLLLPLALCNNSYLRNNKIVGDPMEGALLILAAKGGLTQEQANQKMPRIAEIPFDADYKFMATFHRQNRQNDNIQVFVKGAPEILLKFCASILDKNGNTVAIDHQIVQQQNADMANTGLRVLGLATRTIPLTEFSPTGNLLRYFGKNLTFVGLIGLMDPPRPEVREAIKLCYQAGIAVKMITGDQKLTASAIADEIALKGNVIDGTELSAMDDATLDEKINSVGVFARTAPEQKVRLVNALKAAGHVVAMTGDGVNDAAALKCADIGISMGITGTDVAHEAASMILTDDNFATIVTAVKEGRGIYENMVKFIRFQLSTNIGAILCVAFAPLLNLPLPFTAIQLLWINIIMDGPPAMSLGVDPTRVNCMNEAPRKPNDRILSLNRFAHLFSYGVIMAIGTLGILYVDLQAGDTIHATSLAFTTFVLFQIVNAFNARTEKGTAFNQHFFSNSIFWASIISVIILQIIIVEWTAAEAIFHTTSLTLDDWLLASAIALSVLVFEELRKLIMTLRQ